MAEHLQRSYAYKPILQRRFGLSSSDPAAVIHDPIHTHTTPGQAADVARWRMATNYHTSTSQHLDHNQLRSLLPSNRAPPGPTAGFSFGSHSSVG